MRKLFVTVVSVIALSLTGNAQKISGVVKDDQGKAIEKSTASLLRAKDSSVVKLAVTAADGKFIFQAGPGKYLVSTSHVGHSTVYSKAFEVSGSGDMDLGTITMTKLTADLKAVTVTSKKPMVEVKADKTILNVEGTINATSTDAIDLLRK